jgi:hypothetical protein
MCKGSTTTGTQTPAPQAMATYQQIMQQAQGVAATPYAPYTGQLVAPFTPEETAGVNTINEALPQYMTAADMAVNAAQPISAADIEQYVSPWTGEVVGATEQQFANTLGQNLNAVKGNAIASGAYGGNREGVAEGITSGQVAAQEAPVIAGEEQQGYTQGVNTALAEQQAGLAGAYGLSGITGAQIAGGGAQLTAGAQQQATEQAQLNAAYQQYLNAMGYPFQTTGWEAGVAGGMGSLMGGTSTTTTPFTAQQLIGQLGGAGISAAGMMGAAGILAASRGGAVSAFARGGGISADGVANRTPTLPEAPRTLRAQQRHMVAGHRRAMLFPHGTREIPVAPGMRRTEVNGEAYHYNPHMIDEASVHHLAKGGREHELLDLGPHSKQEVIQRVFGGEAPATIVERDPEGTEVRAAVGTHATAPHQWRHFHRTKVPGNTVHIENPGHTLAIRHHHHRADGGMVPGYDLGGATPGAGGVAGIAAPITFSGSPWAGAKLPVPQTQIPHGSLPAVPKPPQQQQQQNPSADQAKQVGELAKAIQQRMNKPTVLPSAAGVAPSPAGAILPPTGVAPDGVGATLGDAGPVDAIGSDAALYRRGGRVPQYAEGGGDDDAIYVPPDMPAAAPIDITGSPSLPPDGVAGRFSDLRLNGHEAEPPPLPKERPAGAPLALAPEGVAPAEDLPPEIATGKSVKGDNFGDLEKRYGLPGGFLSRTAHIESGGNSNSYNEFSGAKGTFQFIDKTGREYGLVGEGFDDRGDPVKSADAAARLARDNMATLRDRLGREPTAGELYLAHQQGAEHAAALINNPDKPARDVVGDKAVRLNGGTGAETGGQFAQKWMGHYDGTKAGGDTALAYRGVDSGAGAFRPSGRGGITPDDEASGVAPGIDLSAKSKLWPSLIMAGGSMMAASRPGTTLGEAVGHGVVSGAQTYEGLKQQEQAAAMNEKKIKLESDKLAQELNYQRSHLDIMSREATTKEKAEETMAEWRNRGDYRSTGRVTAEGHPISADRYGRGPPIDEITHKPIDPSAPTLPSKANWKASGLELTENGHPILFDTTGGTPVPRDGMTGQPIDPAALSTAGATKAARHSAGAIESIANRLMDENQNQRRTNPNIPEMSFEDALALAHRAPNQSQETIRMLSMAQGAWKAWHADPNNMRYRNAPESTLEFWEQRYGVHPGSPTGTPTPAPAATPTPAAPAGTGTPPTARPAPTPSAAPAPKVESPPWVPPGTPGWQHVRSNKGREGWQGPDGKVYGLDGKPIRRSMN